MQSDNHLCMDRCHKHCNHIMFLFCATFASGTIFIFLHKLPPYKHFHGWLHSHLTLLQHLIFSAMLINDQWDHVPLLVRSPDGCIFSWFFWWMFLHTRCRHLLCMNSQRTTANTSMPWQKTFQHCILFWADYFLQLHLCSCCTETFSGWSMWIVSAPCLLLITTVASGTQMYHST